MFIKKYIYNSRGFSLVELIIAFAMLSIVSVSLLQMFVTSTKITKKSIDLDKANIVAQQAADSFKKYPSADSTKTYYLGNSEMFSADTYISGDTFTKYYSNNWEAVQQSTTELFRLDAQIIKAGNTVTQPSMHVNTVKDDGTEAETDYTIDTYNSYTLTAQSSSVVADGINVQFTDYPDVDSLNVLNTIPVRILYPYDFDNPSNNVEKTIDVNNVSGKNLIIYLFDDEDNQVQINKLAGLISVSTGWSTGTSLDDKDLYTLDITITRIEDSKEILSYTVNKYR